jgi:hypothetical protein
MEFKAKQTEKAQIIIKTQSNKCNIFINFLYLKFLIEIVKNKNILTDSNRQSIT